MNPPLVYCIILNRNGKELLAETLLSVGAMKYPSVKIIVVDNGSDDGSQAMVRKEFPGAELMENGRNLGFGPGNNVGMQRALDAGAEWLILLNNDIAVDPLMLDELMNVALSDQAIGALSPKIYYFTEPETLWYAGGNINFWTGIISHRGLREKDDGRYDRTGDTEYITGCAFLFRASVLRKIGLFDKIYFPIYTEDADLSVRISRAGYRLVYVPSARLWHKVSSSSGGGLTPFKTSLKVEHNLIFFKRYAQWYHWLTIPWCIGGVSLVFVLRQLLKGNFSVLGALFRGFGGALKRLFS